MCLCISHTSCIRFHLGRGVFLRNAFCRFLWKTLIPFSSFYLFSKCFQWLSFLWKNILLISDNPILNAELRNQNRYFLFRYSFHFHWSRQILLWDWHDCIDVWYPQTFRIHGSLLLCTLKKIGVNEPSKWKCPKWQIQTFDCKNLLRCIHSP